MILAYEFFMRLQLSCHQTFEGLLRRICFCDGSPTRLLAGGLRSSLAVGRGLSPHHMDLYRLPQCHHYMAEGQIRVKGGIFSVFYDLVSAIYTPQLIIYSIHQQRAAKFILNSREQNQALPLNGSSIKEFLNIF